MKWKYKAPNSFILRRNDEGSLLGFTVMCDEYELRAEQMCAFGGRSGAFETR